MRAKSVSKLLAVLAIIVIGAGASMVSAGTAWALKVHDPKAAPRFDPTTGEIDFTVPTQCPIVRTQCLWVLFVNEPLVTGKPVVGTSIGASGTLSVPYPQFCGIIQADGGRVLLTVKGGTWHLLQ